MSNQFNGVMSKMLGLALRSIPDLEGKPFETQKTFTAIELGFALGMDVMRIADMKKRDDQAGFLDRNLAGFVASPYCDTEVWERVKRVGIVLPEGFNAGYTGFVLREKSSTIMREAVSLVVHDEELVKGLDVRGVDRSGLIDRITQESRATIRGLGAEDIKEMVDVGNLTPEQIPDYIREGNQYKPSVRERA